MGPAAVAKVESCALTFYVATDKEIWKCCSFLTKLFVFSLERWVFMLCLLSPFSPGGQHDVYTV